MKKCRVCGQLLYQDPILTLEDMPSVAQYLPDDIADARYYEFGENKLEQAAKQYWEALKGMKL